MVIAIWGTLWFALGMIGARGVCWACNHSIHPYCFFYKLYRDHAETALSFLKSEGTIGYHKRREHRWFSSQQLENFYF